MLRSSESLVGILKFGTPAVAVGLACVLLAACGQKEVRETVRLEPPLQTELVTAADFPVSLAFAPDGRLFYNEFETGNIRIITADGELLPEPFAHIEVARPDVEVPVEWGLIGLAIDPAFGKNRHVYVYFMESTSGQKARPVVMRLTNESNKGVDATVIIGDLEESGSELGFVHVAGNIHFGPDGYLYVSIGERLRFASRDLTTPSGKILRVQKEDGAAAPDNPFEGTPDADPRIFAIGLRNTFDFTFHPQSGLIYGNENHTERCDELNIIEAGQDYGWPESRISVQKGTCARPPDLPESVEPIYNYAVPDMNPEDLLSNSAPTAIKFVSGDLYPRLGDALLVCEFVTKFMRRLELAGPSFDEVILDEIVAEDCSLDIAISPDGIIYYSNETEIRRLVPE